MERGLNVLLGGAGLVFEIANGDVLLSSVGGVDPADLDPVCRIGQDAPGIFNLGDIGEVREVRGGDGSGCEEGPDVFGCPLSEIAFGNPKGNQVLRPIDQGARELGLDVFSEVEVGAGSDVRDQLGVGLSAVGCLGSPHVGRDLDCG